MQHDLQSEPAAARFRVLVCADAVHAEHARALALRLQQAGDLQPRCAGFDAGMHGCELLLQLVGDAQASAALKQLQRLRATGPVAALVVSMELATEHLQDLLAAGACDFVCAPVHGDELQTRLHRALGVAGVQAPAVPASVRPAHPALREVIGDSPAFMQQVARLPMLARYDASVLILGDTGTGKEVCAQAIHYLSARSGRPWVAVNCGAIPSELIEAELFGHVKGAYTHAVSARQGLVREAEGGTLFLDEVDALPHGAQAKLLRFLQEKEYRPIGSNTVLHADVRVVAATNRHPAQLASREVFRQDLLYRLNVLTLHLPLLRERVADIPLLAAHFARAAAQRWDKPLAALSPAALKKLVTHDWPGNVRELKNVIERAVLMMAGTGPLTAQDIDLEGPAAAPMLVAADESLRDAKARCVERFERHYIETLLASNGGNVTHAARAAKKNRRAFFELMRKYKIDSDSFRSAA